MAKKFVYHGLSEVTAARVAARIAARQRQLERQATELLATMRKSCSVVRGISVGVGMEKVEGIGMDRRRSKGGLWVYAIGGPDGKTR